METSLCKTLGKQQTSQGSNPKALGKNIEELPDEFRPPKDEFETELE
ncbi:hypothetical protein [Lyngbya aestuarii]